MVNNFDIGQFVNTLTEQSVVNGLVERVKKKRKQMKISQRLLAQKSVLTPMLTQLVKFLKEFMRCFPLREFILQYSAASI